MCSTQAHTLSLCPRVRRHRYQWFFVWWWGWVKISQSGLWKPHFFCSGRYIILYNIEIVFFFFRFLLTSPKHTKHTSRFTTAVTFVARPGGAAGISTERLGLRPRRPRPLWSAALLSTGRPLANLVLEEQGPRTHIPVCNNIYIHTLLHHYIYSLHICIHILPTYVSPRSHMLLINWTSTTGHRGGNHLAGVGGWLWWSLLIYSYHMVKR